MTTRRGGPLVVRKQLAAAVVACLLATSGALLGPVAAEARFTMTARFARETVRYGDQDASTYAIEHVVELQRRLGRAGVYDGPITGYFGSLTRAAVKRLQRRADLPVTGVATQQTWQWLIPRTTRIRVAPKVCRTSGWQACYNRQRHEVMLFRNGRLHNAWMVRGGSSERPTRVGRHYVYWRDKDHVSSLYGSPMPYSQFFDGGQALHGSRALVDPYVGHSHGCVNFYVEDARQLWRLTAHRRLRVVVFGPWS